MTMQDLLLHAAYKLCRTSDPVSVEELTRSFYPHDVEAVQLLMQAFDKCLLTGRLTSKLVTAHGHISDVTPAGLAYCVQS